MSPQRIQLRRTKGWRKPEGAIVVARPSRWGNPYRVGEQDEQGNLRTAERAVQLFRLSVNSWWPPSYKEAVRAELAGRDLACWCPLVDADGNPVPCHADVLLDIANRPDGGDPA